MANCPDCGQPLPRPACPTCGQRPPVRPTGSTAPTRTAWAEAYAKQSHSDFEVFRLLETREAHAICHSLHYLQMAAEKIAKAYRFRDTDTPIDALLSQHVAFSRFFTGFLKSAEIKRRYQGREAQLREVIKLGSKLAREVEKLAPAVARAGSPENTEYPWSQTSRVIVPCEYEFPNLALLQAPGGRNFLMLLEIAILDFSSIRTH